MKKAMFTVAALLLVYAITVTVVYKPAHAQISQIFEEVWKTSAQLHDVQERVARNELVAQLVQTKVDSLGERLAKVEATTEASNKLILGAIGGIIMILLERGLSKLKERKSTRAG